MPTISQGDTTMPTNSFYFGGRGLSDDDLSSDDNMIIGRGLNEDEEEEEDDDMDDFVVDDDVVEYASDYSEDEEEEESFQYSQSPDGANRNGMNLSEDNLGKGEGIIMKYNLLMIRMR